MKQCYVCNYRKPLGAFYKHKYMADGYLNICKDCQKIRSIENHNLNKEERNKKRNQRYYNNKKHHISVCVKNQKIRRSKNHFIRMRDSLSGNLYKSCKKNGWSKVSSLNHYIGCDWIFFKSHMEKLFKDGMNWDNYGEWHIDHIIPTSSAQTEESLYKLYHYTNLQPLWAIENIKKGNKIIVTQEDIDPR
jgi:hypothetical protein